MFTFICDADVSWRLLLIKHANFIHILHEHGKLFFFHRFYYFMINLFFCMIAYPILVHSLLVCRCQTFWKTIFFKDVYYSICLSNLNKYIDQSNMCLCVRMCLIQLKQQKLWSKRLWDSFQNSVIDKGETEWVKERRKFTVECTAFQYKLNEIDFHRCEFHSSTGQ